MMLDPLDPRVRKALADAFDPLNPEFIKFIEKLEAEGIITNKSGSDSSTGGATRSSKMNVREFLQKNLNLGVYLEKHEMERCKESTWHALRFAEANDTGYVVVLPFLCPVDGDSDLVYLVYSPQNEEFCITACFDSEGNVEVSGYKVQPEGDIAFQSKHKSHEECVKVISWTSL